MNKNIQNAITAISFLLVLVFFSVGAIIAPDKDISYSERRSLASLPELTLEALLKTDGGEGYFGDMEKYLLDQFVARDSLRALNASVRRYAFLQKDVNGIVVKNGNIFKIDNRLDEEAVARSANVYLKVIERYFSENGANIYYTVVPDKNYYSAAGNYPSMDYERLFGIMREKLGDIEFVDIRNELSASDYYRTDLHWDQSKLFGVANKLLSAMGAEAMTDPSDYTKKSFDGFKGAYYGQAALPVKTDTLYYLTNSMLESCTVYDYEYGRYVPMYAEEKLGGVDSYDVFLHGARAIMRIENPSCEGRKQLVVFRDSFGSSLAPLLAENYSSIILVDLRYVSSANLGRFVEFEDGCDVLFMYNTGSLKTKGQGSVS